MPPLKKLISYIGAAAFWGILWYILKETILFFCSVCQAEIHSFFRYANSTHTKLSQRKIENDDSKACILTVFETIWNCRKNENNVSKACILTVFETI